MCHKPTMASHPTSKPLNPEAQPWKPKDITKLPPLPHQIFQQPPPPPPQVETWLPAHPFMYRFPTYPPQIYLKNYKFPYSSYDIDSQPQAVCPRFRRIQRGNRVGRRSGGKSCVRQWKPKNTRSNECGGVGGGCGGGVVSSSLPPPPPPPPSDFFLCDKTTVMIRNIPNQYRRNTFLELLDKLCEENQMEYDFVYLPMDFVRKDNYGYAFVNFTSANAAMKIRELLNSHKWGYVQTSCGNFESKKTCEITWARIQGKDGLIRHFANSNFNCDTKEYLPVFFCPPRNGATSTSLPQAIGKCKL